MAPARATPAEAAVSVVVVAGGRRPLTATVGALTSQLSDRDELVVVAARGSAPDGGLPGDAIAVEVPEGSGVAAAVAAGLQRANGDLVAVFTDESVPASGWLVRARAHLADDPSLHAVGGRLAVFAGGRTSNAFLDRGPVTRVDAIGRLVNRLSEVPASPVTERAAFLARSNACFRREALTPGPALPFVPFAELDVLAGLDAGLRGRRLHYDSDLVVYVHRAEPTAPEERAFQAAFVQAVAARRLLPWPKSVAALLWAFLIGSRETPGWIYAPYLRLRATPALDRFRAARRARGAARRFCTVDEPDVAGVGRNP